MSTRSLSTVVLAFVALLAAAALRGGEPSARASRPTQGVKVADLASLPASSPASTDAGPEAGILCRYRVELDQRITFDVSGAFVAGMDAQGLEASASAPRPQTLACVVEGELEAAIHRGTSQTVIGVRLRGPRVRIEGEGRSAEADLIARVERDLGEEVLLVATPRGVVREVRFPDGMSQEAQGLARAIASLLSLEFPREGASTWPSEEEDATGRFHAIYTASTDSDGVQVRRGKTRYEELRTVGVTLAPGQDARCEIEGMTTGTYDPARRVWTRVEVSEVLRIEGVSFAQDVRLASRGCIELVSEARDERPAARLASFQGGGAEEATREAARRMEAERARQRVEGADARSLVQELSRLLAAGMHDTREWYDAWERLSILCRLDDGVAAYVGRLVAGQSVHAEVACALAGALGSAGTPATQEALIVVLRARGLDVRVEDAARVALALVETPTQNADGFLREAASGPTHEESARASLVCLGILADRLSASDEPRAASLAEFLVASFGRSRDAAWTRAVLDALGNARSASTLGTVLAYTRDGDAEVRAAAAWALRSLEDAESLARLESLASSDPSDLVRASAAEAIDTRRR